MIDAYVVLGIDFMEADDHDYELASSRKRALKLQLVLKYSYCISYNNLKDIKLCTAMPTQNHEMDSRFCENIDAWSSEAWSTSRSAKNAQESQKPATSYSSPVGTHGDLDFVATALDIAAATTIQKVTLSYDKSMSYNMIQCVWVRGICHKQRFNETHN